MVKVYSGELQQKQLWRNTRTNKTERVTRYWRVRIFSFFRLLNIFADDTYNATKGQAGHSISVMGVNNVMTGDTLVDSKVCLY